MNDRATAAHLPVNRPWSRLPLVGVPLAALFLVFAPAFYDLVADWYNDANYSHGFLIPVISVLLLWRRRDFLRSLEFRPDALGLPVMVAGLVLFVLANAAAEYYTLRLSFVVTLFGLVWYLLGRTVARAAWFEIFYLIFMIPLPYVIYYTLAFPMQAGVTTLTVAVLDVIGIEVVRQGNIIHLAGQSLEVAAACSGIRSLLALLALGALYARLTQRGSAAQVILFIAMAPAAVAGNVVRVVLTSLLVHIRAVDITAEPLHTLLGLSVFLFAFMMLHTGSVILRRIRQ